MPFDGSGNFSPSPAPNFPAISGASISSTYYNAVINDIATGLSNALTRDGQGKPSGNIDWNAKNLSNVGSFGAVSGAFTGALSAASLDLTTPLGIAEGGSGLSTVPTNGQLLIGNGANYTLANIVAGAGITVTNSAGGISIACSLSGMTYPAAGIAVSTGAAWTTSKAAPAGVLVGDTDAQTLTNKTVTGLATGSTVKDAGGTSYPIGYRSAPISATTSGVLTVVEVGKVVPATAGVTINNTVFAAGDIFAVYNDSAASITITQGAGVTMRLAGTTTTGSRTLSARGYATIWFKSASEAIVGGAGVS